MIGLCLGTLFGALLAVGIVFGADLSLVEGICLGVGIGGFGSMLGSMWRPRL